jgi:tetratricopeptide (TPR) repeat protein
MKYCCSVMRRMPLLIILGWMSCSAVLGQSASQMSFSDLIAQAESLIDSDQPASAIPLLKEIINRTDTLQDRDAKQSVQTARLQLGSSYAKIQRWKDARDTIQDYLRNTPVTERISALQILAQAALAEQDWDALDQAAKGIMEETPGIREQRVAETFLLQAHFNLGRYTEALELLPEVIERAEDPDNIRSYRIMKLRCLFETGETAQMIQALPQTFRGAARDDVTLNLTLLRMGDDLFERQEYRKALALYRLVLPKQQLLVRQQQRLEETENSRNGEWSIEELREALETLRQVPEYDIHIAYRAAQIYSEQKRFWEAVVLFERLYDEHPQREEGQAAYLQKVLLLFEIGADEEAVAESIEYLEKNRSGLYPRMICSRLAQHYLRIEKFREALALGPRYADRWSRAADADEKAQETDLRYLFSFVRFQLGEYEEAAQAFDRVIQTDPDSQAAIDSNYWKAMCRLLQQNYEQAYREFIAYREKWPRASFAPAALFRAGVCRFGLEDYDQAKTIFESFIRDYPDDALMPEALTMHGDLLGADGAIDEALAAYTRAFQIVAKNYKAANDPILRAQIPLPATYATFQAARTLEADAEAHMDQKEEELAEEKYRQLIAWVERYIQAFGDDADWAQGVFWIGKAQIELGETEKAATAYLDTVIRRGDDPAQEGVAAILFDMANIIRRWLDEPQREKILQDIQRARSRATAPALKIRLDVLLAELDKTHEQLGRELLAREKNLEAVPPSGLALMCAALLEKQEDSRSAEFFNLFAERYEDSPFRVTAFELHAKDLYRQGKTDAAFDLAEEALGLYGATADTGWAQLMKGKVEMARGEVEQAAETFNMIFNVSAWRGPITAEAMFRMAEARQAQGDLEKAFAFFQRTYLLYKAYDDGRWAAEAYLRSAECLRKMGRVTAARNTYRAMLLDKYVRDLPQAQTAKEILGPEETAELLSGNTNSLQAVEIEVSP